MLAVTWRGTEQCYLPRDPSSSQEMTVHIDLITKFQDLKD